jgi:hypothetical protein
VDLAGAHQLVGDAQELERAGEGIVPALVRGKRQQE